MKPIAVEYFKDLPLNEQESLLSYITNTFKMVKNINSKYSAYGLKQSYTRLNPSCYHVTSNCFKEAMESEGFNTVSIHRVSVPNWRFNVGKVKYSDQ